jgi:DNA-binding MarR family transcriptional regulator
MDRTATGRLLFSEPHSLAELNCGPPQPTDLAERAALTKSGLTSAIDRLESQRLI